MLYFFCTQPDCADGYGSFDSLILDQKGNLYGTTPGGGSDGYGAVFKLAPDGTETVLYSFMGGNDGAAPFAGLLTDKKGNFYGTTADGGGSDSCYYGCGTVFKLAPDGTETVLYRFCSQLECADGTEPSDSLIVDKKGNLYGTTEQGGDGGANGGGIVFKLKK